MGWWLQLGVLNMFDVFELKVFCVHIFNFLKKIRFSPQFTPALSKQKKAQKIHFMRYIQ